MTLAGGTQFVPDFDMDAGNDTLSGVTMMGKVVSLNDDNIENLPPGTVFDGRYSVVAPLGKGGMGWSTKSSISIRSNDVAREGSSESCQQSKGYRSLKDEVAHGLRWNHPKSSYRFVILEVESVQPFVVMELMDGGDVDEHLARQMVDRWQSIDVLSVVHEAIASALSVMHEDGHIHLDLKPENLLMNADGNSKVVRLWYLVESQRTAGWSQWFWNIVLRTT